MKQENLTFKGGHAPPNKVFNVMYMYRLYINVNMYTYNTSRVCPNC